MLKNYFRTAWRNLLKNKTYSALNLAGLATGMAVALLIGLWIVEVFLTAGMAALLITFLTVSYQAIKAAVANPVKSLRIE